MRQMTPQGGLSIPTQAERREIEVAKKRAYRDELIKVPCQSSAPYLVFFLPGYSFSAPICSTTANLYIQYNNKSVRFHVHDLEFVGVVQYQGFQLDDVSNVLGL